MNKRHRTTAIALAALIATALATLPLHATADQVFKVTDGFLQENKVYTDKVTLDLTGLDNTRKVSSTATVANGQIRGFLHISGGNGGTPSDTFATSLYMTCTKMHIANPSASCYYYIEYLPPNAYIVLKETTSYKTDGMRSIAIQTGWDYNTTLFIVDSNLETNGGGPSAFLTFAPTNKAPHSLVDNCVMYVKNMKVAKHSGVLSFGATSSLEQQSALIFEDIEGVSLRGPFMLLSSYSIKDHSAIIAIRVKLTHPTNADLTPVLQTNLLVDGTSAFSLIDIDASNGFKGTTMPAFVNAVITGGGEIVFSRLIMQKSGLGNKQPQTNTNFWVSARMTANNDLTVAQLQAQNFNVNSQNVYNWDGTGADGTTCAPAGAIIPGRATYKLVDGKCTPTCMEGYIPPACTAPAKSQCRVDNCDLCYRITKTKCMMCAEHTKMENNDQICRCPANLEHCQVCPTDSTCTMCVEGYNLTKGGAPCFPCSLTVPNCAHCDEPNVCEWCAPNYNVSADKKECYSCTIANCLHCDGQETCDQCIPHYNVSTLGEPQNRCISCNVANCVLCNEDDKCAKCADGFTMPEGKANCVACPIAHCERCDVEGVCAQCPDQHTPVDGKHCYPCTMPGCLTCDGDEQCADCDDKYTLVGKTCVPCDIPNCKSCLVDGVCDQCEPTYQIVVKAGKTTCVHCDLPNCASCLVDDTCHECAPYYNLSTAENRCFPCDIDGCAACDTDSHCSACANGNPPLNDGKECVSCAVSNCVYCNATDSCAECSDRHSLSPDADKLKCTSCNIDHCLFCGATDTCQDCEASYNVSKDGAKCNSCFMSDCLRCDVDGVCAQCDTSLSVSLNGGECTPCDIGNCTYCALAGECGMCKCGLVPTSDGEKCVPCTVANCKHCELPGDGLTCVECIDGYDVSDGSCKKSGLPSWAVFLIVVAGTIVLAAAFCTGMFLYLRHQAKLREMERDAEERRRNRQAKGRGSRHHMEIGILDLGDIEGAASGVRDNQNKYNAVF